MRADRLVAILNLLQVRGQVTALEVSEELEISERTARRDLEALGQAGVPIYSMQGRNGGWRLAGGGKTDLSGLTAEETRALFLVAGPSTTASPAVRAAVRKLVRALPEPFREAADATSERVLIDRGWEGGSQAPPTRTPPLLDDAQRCVVEGRQVSLDYVARDGASSTRIIDPLGLASKGASWYLVANTANGLRTFRVDRIQSMTDTGERVVRPEGFDLADAWQLITDVIEDKRMPVVVNATVAPDFLSVVRWIFGQRVRIGPSNEDGRISVEIRGHNLRSFAGELGGLGSNVLVESPAEMREQLKAIGEELIAAYSE